VLAVVVVRDGVLGAGSDETVAECGGRVLVVGSGTQRAVDALTGVATDVGLAEVGDYAPAAWAAALATYLASAGETRVVLPASPDGRDLAPRLAMRMGRLALLNATEVTDQRVVLARGAGLLMHTVTPPPAFVATLLPGVRGVDVPADPAPAVRIVELQLDAGIDSQVLQIVPPDPATIDLGEAARIVGGGAGLDSADRLAQLAEFGAALGASVGATRVITDRHWIGHERQIGTTGAVVDPRLYIAFGVSGAVQHTSGLGTPDHIVSINTDPHCPMMQMADLAVVADANAVLDELLKALP
jgi:electron transfer flavoprotein alpha subunit